MRWIVLLLLLLGLGAGSFYYWQQHADTEENPLLFCPNDSWLILQCNNLNKTIGSMQDSHSIYAAIPSFHQTLDLLKTIETNDALFSGRAFIALSGKLDNPMVTVISSQTISTQFDAWKNITANSEWQVLTTHNTYSSFVEEAPITFQNTAINDANTVFVSPSGIRHLIETSLTNNFKTRLIDELPKSDWIGFEFSDEGLFQATAVAKVKGTEAIEQNVSNLFRYLPSKTVAAMSFAGQNANYAIIYCDYGLEDSTELFLLIEETQDSESAPDEFVNNHFSKSWIKTANINMIGTLQLLSKNKQASKRFMDDYNAFNRLTEAAVFKSLGYKTSESSFSIYIQKPAKYSQGLVLDEIEEFNTITSILFQTHSEFSDTKSYSLLVSHHQETKDESRKYWSLILDKPAEAGPWKFINHYTGEEEILIQDKLHQLYLISREGKVLWKKQLGNVIIGDIQMIDALSSGKNQMLLNTNERLMILDRNGNNIDGFPVNLSAQPSTSPTAVRYSKDSEMRIFANAGNYLFNYSVEGSEIKGWNKPRTGKLEHPLKLLQIGSKDYLVAVSSGDSILFFDRSGKERKEAIELKLNVTQSLFNVNTNMSNSALTTLDVNGNIVTTTFEGKQSSINISADSNMSIAVHSGSEVRYVTISGDQMTSYDEDGKEVLGYLFPTILKNEIKWINDKLGWIVLSDGNELYVTDIKNGPMEKMPIPGDLRCILLDTDKNGVEILSHQSDGTLTCYQLTY